MDVYHAYVGNKIIIMGIIGDNIFYLCPIWVMVFQSELYNVCDGFPNVFRMWG